MIKVFPITSPNSWTGNIISPDRRMTISLDPQNLMWIKSPRKRPGGEKRVPGSHVGLDKVKRYNVPYCN